MIGASSESGSSRMGHQLRNMRGQRGKRIPRDSLAGFGSNQRLARERNREAAKDRTARACLRSPRAAARQLLYPLHSPPGLPGKHSREWDSWLLLHMRLQDPGPAFLKPTLCGAVSRRGVAGERKGGGERTCEDHTDSRDRARRGTGLWAARIQPSWALGPDDGVRWGGWSGLAPVLTGKGGRRPVSTASLPVALLPDCSRHQTVVGYPCAF